MISVFVSVGILALQVHYGVIPSSLTLVAIKSAGWPYGLLIIGLGLLCAICVPAQLDHERRIALDQKDAIIASKDVAINELQQELSRKRPIEVAKQKELESWLDRFSDEEKKFLCWLLRQGRTEDYRLRNCGLPQSAIDGAMTKGRQCGLIKDDFERRSHNISFINPNYAECLSSFCHPW